MKLKGMTRLFLALSVAWLLFWVIGYLDDDSLALRKKITGFFLFGVLPVAIPWTFVWIRNGFRSQDN